MRASRIAVVVVGLAALCGAASAQTIQTHQPPVAEPLPSSSPVQHVDPARPGGPRAPQPVVMKLRPGGMLLKSFDKNGDGLVSRDELVAGAKAAFKAADENGDGLVGGIEQTTWATSYGGVNDVLSNPMMFDSNMDHSVTEDEFVAGVMRLADPVKDASGGLQVAKLMIEAPPEAPPPEQGPQVVRERRGG